MHYSRVATAPGHGYSAATAVLMNEIIKGLISLVIAYSRIDTSAMSNDVSQAPYSSVQRPSFFSTSSYKLRRLRRDVFSHDCWKLSIPAILYGMCPHICLSFLLSTNLQLQLSKITSNTSPCPTLMLPHSRSPIKWRSWPQLRFPCCYCAKNSPRFNGYLSCAWLLVLALFRSNQAVTWKRIAHLMRWALSKGFQRSRQPASRQVWLEYTLRWFSKTPRQISGFGVFNYHYSPSYPLWAQSSSTSVRRSRQLADMPSLTFFKILGRGLGQRFSHKCWEVFSQRWSSSMPTTSWKVLQQAWASWYHSSPLSRCLISGSLSVSWLGRRLCLSRLGSIIIILRGHLRRGALVFPHSKHGSHSKYPKIAKNWDLRVCHLWAKAPLFSHLHHHQLHFHYSRYDLLHLHPHHH